jgi:hypothetical protein
MSEDGYAFLFAGLYLVLALAGVSRAQQLLRRFAEKYPDEANRSIPNVSNRFRHPEELFYFFRPNSVELLRADKELWRLRQHTKWLLILTLGIPPFALAVLLSVILVAVHSR